MSLDSARWETRSLSIEGSPRVLQTAFMAHPVGAPTPRGVQENIINAKRWYKFFITRYDIAIVADWIICAEVLDDHVPADRLRGQLLNAHLLRHVDALIICGGRISTGMRAEMMTAAALDIPILEWISAGKCPPIREEFKSSTVPANWIP